LEAPVTTFDPPARAEGLPRLAIRRGAPGAHPASRRAQSRLNSTIESTPAVNSPLWWVERALACLATTGERCCEYIV